MITAEGTFEVKLEPQNDEAAPAGRMLINKTYSGEMVGTGIGQMISKRIENGAAAYYAVEEFSGTLASKTGSFTLLHEGFMDSASQSLKITIMSGSGTDEFATISGSMEIIQEDGTHSYILNYSL